MVVVTIMMVVVVDVTMVEMRMKMMVVKLMMKITVVAMIILVTNATPFYGLWQWPVTRSCETFSSCASFIEFIEPNWQFICLFCNVGRMCFIDTIHVEILFI